MKGMSKKWKRGGVSGGMSDGMKEGIRGHLDEWLGALLQGCMSKWM